jgi:hypothetical protein
MDVLIALLIVLLFAALPMQPYTASGRGHYPSRSNEPKPVPHANEPKPRTKPLNGKFEAEVEPIDSEYGLNSVRNGRPIAKDGRFITLRQKARIIQSTRTN